MHVTVPYTAIIREPCGSYHVRYLDLPQGISAARRCLKTDTLLDLEGDVEIAALLPGTHSTDLPIRRAIA